MTLETLLHDADPLRHEAPPLDRERQRMREVVLTRRVNSTTAPRRGRLSLVTALVVVAIAFGAVGYQLWLRGATPLFAAVRFEVRLAEEQPSPGLVVAQVRDTGRLIYVDPRVVVGNDDVASSWVSQDAPDRYSVIVRLLPTGAERMRQATQNHVGRPVAILIDGSVVMAPTVRSAIEDSAVIDGDFSQSEAERIVGGIANR